MFRKLIAIASLALMGSFAHAQDAGQIASVQSGHSCKGCNLFQADLAYLDLPKVNLSGARLRQSDMSLSTMNYADFTSANLSISNMFAGRFTGASFKNADLSRVVLVGAYVGSADFTGANLEGANLSGTEMETAKGLTQGQLDRACGDEATTLPEGLRIPSCLKLMQLQGAQ